MGYSHDEWTSLIIHEKMAGNRDAQSHAQSQIKIIVNKTRPGLLLVGRYPLFRTRRGMCLLVVGEHELYHSVWEPPIMYLVWKIPRSLGCYVDNESIPLKILFIPLFQNSSSGTSANPCFPLRRAYVFTFIAESSSSYKRH